MKRNISKDDLDILDSILPSILAKIDLRIFFVDEPGGTGKKYRYICLIHFLRANETKVITSLFFELELVPHCYQEERQLIVHLNYQ